MKKILQKEDKERKDKKGNNYKLYIFFNSKA